MKWILVALSISVFGCVNKAAHQSAALMANQSRQLRESYVAFAGASVPHAAMSEDGRREWVRLKMEIEGYLIDVQQTAEALERATR